MEYILRTRYFDHTLRFIFLTNLKYFGIFRDITPIIKIFKFTVFSSGSFCQIYRVTEEALIAETMVWPNFFLMNVFFALKGSKLFIIIYHQISSNTHYICSSSPRLVTVCLSWKFVVIVPRFKEGEVETVKLV